VVSDVPVDDETPVVTSRILVASGDFENLQIAGAKSSEVLIWVGFAYMYS
jgi:hypothetical protein